MVVDDCSSSPSLKSEPFCFNVQLTSSLLFITCWNHILSPSVKCTAGSAPRPLPRKSRVRISPSPKISHFFPVLPSGPLNSESWCQNIQLTFLMCSLHVASKSYHKLLCISVGTFHFCDLEIASSIPTSPPFLSGFFLFILQVIAIFISFIL